MAVIPAFVGIRRHFFSTSVGAAVHAFVVFEDVRVVLGQAHHPRLHRLVGVVLLELENIIGGGRPRENHVDVIVRPNVLGRVPGDGFLCVGIFSDRCCKRKQQREDDEETQGGSRSSGAKCNGRGGRHAIVWATSFHFFKRSCQRREIASANEQQTEPLKAEKTTQMTRWAHHGRPVEPRC